MQNRSSGRTGPAQITEWRHVGGGARQLAPWRVHSPEAVLDATRPRLVGCPGLPGGAVHVSATLPSTGGRAARLSRGRTGLPRAGHDAQVTCVVIVANPAESGDP